MLTVGVPLGLLGLVGVPVVVGLHWFRRRHRPHTMTALFLYPPPVVTAAAGRRRERVRVVGSLLAEVLAVLAITAWLAEVQVATPERAPSEVVIVDDRMRLQARDAAGVTAAQRVRQALLAHWATLPEESRLTVIATGDPPQVLVGPGATVAAATQALAAWDPRAPWHEPDAAVTLARRLAGGGTIIVASDRQEGWPHDGGLIAAGVARPSSGWAEATWLRRPTEDTVVLRSYGPPGRRVEVRGEGRLLAEGVSGPAPLPFTLTHPPAVVQVQMLGDDPLPDDDRIELLRPAERVVRVRGQAPGLARVANALGWTTLVDAGAAEVVINAAGQPGAWTLTIAPVAGGPVVVGPFLARTGHPLLADLDATGLWWTGAAPTLPGEALMMAGEHVLLAEVRQGQERHVTLAGDPAAPGIAGHPWWPGFLANVIEARRAALPGVADPQAVVGRVVPVIAPAGARVRDPHGYEHDLAADADGQVLVAVHHAGRYDVAIADGPAVTLMGLALDPRQGDLAAAVTMTHLPPPALGTATHRRTAAERLLPLVLAAMAVIAAWFAFRRESSGAA